MKEEIRKIRIDELDYPELLKNIADPPPAIYIKGQIPKANFFAIVGTRRFSLYGKQVALEISRDLALAGLGIISGMARGIDTFSHQGCLEAGGKTIAVLGAGIDEASIYPKENLNLSREIVKQGGCLLSELEPGAAGSQFTFPQRNRIISAMSIGVLIVEAKEKSGALITARLAREQGKKVFAIPGPIHSLNSWGPNYLIKHGAKLAQTADDILKELNLAQELSSHLEQKQEIVSDSSPEGLILRMLKEQSLHIEEIIKRTNLSAQQVCGLLAIMEIRGRIRNLGNNNFAIKR